MENILIFSSDYSDNISNFSALELLIVDFDNFTFSLFHNFADFTGNRGLGFGDEHNILGFFIVVQYNLINNSVINGNNLVFSSSFFFTGLDSANWFTLDDGSIFFGNC